MKKARITVLSDIHLGHRGNDPVEMVESLNRYLIDKGSILEKTDILFIAGDTFDRLLQLDYPALPHFDFFFFELLKRCEKLGVIFRVLEGTPSHDRRQPKRIEMIARISGSKCDFRYIDSLTIEYIEKFDCSVLYIPDEYKPSTATTLAEVKELMASRNMSTVDIAVMHGQFGYQCPVKLYENIVHDETEYERLVKELIFIGHVHTHSRSGKIVAQGSFDRLKHGEEEPKGFVYAIVGDGVKQVEFIENKRARIYKTIEVYGLDMAETIKKIDELILSSPENIALRIEAEPEHPIFKNIPSLQTRHLMVTFSKLPKNKETGESTNIEVYNEFNDWVNVEITPSNVVSLIMDRIKATQDSETANYVESLVKELVNECRDIGR